MAAVTKAELTEGLIQKLDLPRKEARIFIELLFSTIKELLEKNEGIKISGFGSFKVRAKKARPGRNPKTGEDVSITARHVVTFKVGPKLKMRIAQDMTQQSQD